MYESSKDFGSDDNVKLFVGKDSLSVETGTICVRLDLNFCAGTCGGTKCSDGSSGILKIIRTRISINRISYNIWKN